MTTQELSIAEKAEAKRLKRKASSLAWYHRNAEVVNATKREHYSENREDGTQRVREWNAANPEAKAASLARYNEKNPAKVAAHAVLKLAVRSKQIAKPDCCEACSASAAQLNGHHDDYAKPLAVRWLCQPCHSAWHRANGPGLNG
jgi:transposase-like protein